MRATLEFDLDNPDDKIAHLRCVKATDMALALWEITRMRKDVMYELEGKEGLADWEVANLVLEKMFDKIREQGINIDELLV